MILIINALPRSWLANSRGQIQNLQRLARKLGAVGFKRPRSAVIPDNDTVWPERSGVHGQDLGNAYVRRD